MKALEPDDTTPVAWRCESDRKLHPSTEGSYVVYTEEPGPLILSAGSMIRRRSYYTRRMIVCQPCRRTIANLEAGQ